ncbi:MAG: Bug family tripartite tricarboxylate transporter substrate binding protein [Lautropia sp.]
MTISPIIDRIGRLGPRRPLLRIATPLRPALLGVALAALSLLGLPGSAAATSVPPYPASPLTLVVPYAAGGPADLIARIVADGLRQELRQSVVVENRPGASGTLGSASVAKARPDGYTLLIGSGTTHAIAPAAMKGITYDPIADFEPISLTGNTTFVLLAAPGLEARDLQALVRMAKERPGELMFGTTGPGTVYDLAAATLESLTGARFTRVPYKGFAAISVDLLGGRVHVSVNPPEPLGKSGRLRPLAIVGPNRLPTMPDVPTAEEAGVAGFEVPVWSALFAPAKTPPEIVALLSKAMQAAVARPEIRARLIEVGLEPIGSDAETLRARVETDLRRASDLVRSGRFKAD